MDSVTQLALGAAVGEATLGRKVGNKAIVWGAICGTIPDLDVFIPFNDSVNAFVSHRSFSHSLLTLALLTPCLTWIIRRLHPSTDQYYRGWLTLVYLAFATHVLLDSFTAYGTQIFWPISNHPVMWSTIFIVDPLYTVPLLLGVAGALAMSREKDFGHRVNTVGLVLSTLYLSWTVVAKFHVQSFAKERLAEQQISYTHMLVQPTPINTLLWRVLIMKEDSYAEGFYSILDRHQDIQLWQYPNFSYFLDPLKNHPPVENLRWFTQGFWGIRQIEDRIVISDLRMGMEPNYVFSFNVGEKHQSHITPIKSEKRIYARYWKEQLKWIFMRIWHATGFA